MKSMVAMAALLAALGLAGCQKEPSYEASPATAASPAATPAEYTQGETLFNTHCATCHGAKAAGTNHGPSFIDKIYEPNHHGDSAFHLAARGGVRAHHWSYGNMPPVHDVTPSDVDLIVGYVRWLQRQAGIQ